MYNLSDYMLKDETMQEIRRESARAIQKHGRDNTPLGNRGRDHAQHVLVEEIGEVAKVFNEYNLGNISLEEFQSQLKKEIVQVAAVAAMWLEKEISYGG